MARLIHIADRFIYALVDPRDEKVRYIGRTMNPDKRLSGHLACPKGSPTSEWIRGLRAIDLKPRMVILQKVEGGSFISSRVERETIAKYRKEVGDLLLNRNGDADSRRAELITNADGSPFVLAEK